MPIKKVTNNIAELFPQQEYVGTLYKEAEGLFNACEEMAKRRYQSYIRMSKMDWSNE